MPHRRFLKHVVITTALAFAVTVLIAWTLAWITPDAVRPAYTMSGVPGAIANWLEPVPSDWPDTPRGTSVIVPRGSAGIGLSSGNRVRVRQGMGLGVSVQSGPKGTVIDFDDDPNHVLDQVRVGWPVHTMVHRGPDDARPAPQSALARLYELGVAIPGKPQPDRRLPLRPIWRVFVPSILVTAVLLELLWQAWHLPARIRMRRRNARGQCLNCGYDLTGMEQCPECGTPIG